jgi:hypothetical protein
MKIFLKAFCTWAIIIFDLDFCFERWDTLPPELLWESLSPAKFYCDGPWVDSYIFSEGKWIVDEWGINIPF